WRVRCWGPIEAGYLWLSRSGWIRCDGRDRHLKRSAAFPTNECVPATGDEWICVWWRVGSFPRRSYPTADAGGRADREVLLKKHPGCCGLEAASLQQNGRAWPH